MVKHLSDVGLIAYYPRRGTYLTDDGRRLALRMIRRHRLIETFLERVLGYDWSEVHREAEELEHAVSETFIERVDALLDSPTVDPHGDPIPQADGTIADSTVLPLLEVPPGAEFEVARIISDESEFLRLMKDRGVVPGARFVLSSKNEVAGTISLTDRATGDEATFGYDVGHSILVR
jgi:DtxR family Mn-dependent transcriptional regulator